MVGVEALQEITTVPWLDVKIQWNVPLGLERGIHSRMKSLIEPRRNAGRPGLRAASALMRVGDVILIVNAVGRMKVKVQRRLPQVGLVPTLRRFEPSQFLAPSRLLRRFARDGCGPTWPRRFWDNRAGLFQFGLTRLAHGLTLFGLTLSPEQRAYSNIVKAIRRAAAQAQR
jgi:hypothetical protein